MGLEPHASRVSIPGRSSTKLQLHYGGPSGVRTHDAGAFNTALYQLSYRSIMVDTACYRAGIFRIFSPVLLTNLSYVSVLVGRVGFEPTMLFRDRVYSALGSTASQYLPVISLTAVRHLDLRILNMKNPLSLR